MPPPVAASCCRATIARATTRIPVGSMPRCSSACFSERWNSDVLGKPPVKLGPAVSEKPEGRAVLPGCRQVQRRHQRSGLLCAELCQNVAALVADEAVAVEAQSVLGAASVCGDVGLIVRHRM